MSMNFLGQTWLPSFEDLYIELQLEKKRYSVVIRKVKRGRTKAFARQTADRPDCTIANLNYGVIFAYSKGTVDKRKSIIVA